MDERLDHLHSLAELLCFTTTLTLSGRSTTADELKNGACIGAELELSARILIYRPPSQVNYSCARTLVQLTLAV